MPREQLKALSLIELTREVLARLDTGQVYQTHADLVLASQLQQSLETTLDVHSNRFSARRYYDLLRPILATVPRSRLQGATVVDLGCGSLNPFAFSFFFLMLGVARAYAIDIDPVQGMEKAVKALATCASWFLIDSKRIIDPDCIPPEEVLKNLSGFDLAKLATGDPTGLAKDRMLYHNESIFDLSLSEGAVDLVFSVSCLEHLNRIEEALEALRRITRVGGYGHHLIDFADHRIYPGEVASPFEFLKIDTRDELVYGGNRLRCHQFCEFFEKHGFAVERVETARSANLSREERAQFVEPYRSMPQEELTMVCARVLVRRR
ncbi:MAG: methyltransferase domain-containing protein [Deltaproteobacteria bacterium]|nr:methyltransferase domain-containing protein [Deltaproteobacteria bacterium]